MARILMVVTGANTLELKDGTAHPTGFWAEELVVAHRDLTAAGHDIVIATPGGVAPTVDRASLDPAAVGGQEAAGQLEDYLAAISGELSRPVALSGVSAADFDAVVLPGGHGPMTDLAFDVDLGKVLIEANSRGAVIAPFCHGPAGLLSAVDANGEFAFAGRRLTVFTDEEETQGGTGEKTPWFVESTLRRRGAVIESGPAWSSHIVIDGNLVSGQNPQSSAAVAQQVVVALAARSAT